MNDECDWCGKKCDGKLCEACRRRWAAEYEKMERERKRLANERRRAKETRP